MHSPSAWCRPTTHPLRARALAGLQPERTLRGHGVGAGQGRLWDARSRTARRPAFAARGRGVVRPVQPGWPQRGYRVVRSDRATMDGSRRPSARRTHAARSEGRTAQFSQDGRRVVTASEEDGTARVWDAQTGEPLSPPLQQPLPGADREIAWARLSPDVENRLLPLRPTIRLASGTGAPARQKGEAMQRSHWVRTASLSPDGRRVLTASWDHTTRIWDAQTGRPLSAPMHHADRLRSARFSPDGFRVVTTSTDHTVRVWDAFDGQPLTKPFAHQHRARWAEFSPDGLRVVTASEDGTARVWDIRPGQEQVRRLPSACAVDFSKDGRKFVLGHRLGGLSVYSCPRSSGKRRKSRQFRHRSARFGSTPMASQSSRSARTMRCVFLKRGRVRCSRGRCIMPDR